jgi:hypothetical protein
MIGEQTESRSGQKRLTFLMVLAITTLVGIGLVESGNLQDGTGLMGVLYVISMFWMIVVNASFKPNRSYERLLIPLVVAIAVLLGYGMLESHTWQNSIGFAAVLLAAAAPALFWIRSGMAGVPILPAVAALYVIYYGLSSVRDVGAEEGYTPDQVLNACLTVAVFLVAATLVNAWICTGPSVRRSQNTRLLQFSDRMVVKLIVAGLGVGLVYGFGDLSGLLDWLGSFHGVAHSVAGSATALASFLLGHATARKNIDAKLWVILCGAFAVLLLLSLSALFLNEVTIFMLAAVAGYVVTARRIPWRLLAVAFLIVSVFQAGKKEMRYRHWEFHGSIASRMSLTKVPGLVVEWFEVGTDALIEGTNESSVVDRASLLSQLIRVEQWTPRIVPYLNGETYTYLPYVVVPRFVMPDKPTSQVVMNMLDVRYGFLTAGETRYVAVGINLVPEGIANFGYLGVILIGIVFGALTGFFSRLSIGKSPISLQMLLSIVTLVTLLNLEADLSSLLTTLFQSLISVTIFFFVFQFVTEPAHRRTMLSSVSRSRALQRHAGTRG